MKNTHLNHVEDLIILEGFDGACKAINTLNNLRKHKITTKVDGSPSFIIGIDPFDGIFFVATKSLFNKIPILFKSIEEIETEKNEKLRPILKELYIHFNNLLSGVYQGDFLFSKTDLKEITIDNKLYTVFHPNTLAYAVNEKISANIGVVFHTKYTGDSIETLTANQLIDQSHLKQDNVWLFDTKTVYTDNLEIGLKIPDSDWLLNEPTLQNYALMFINSIVKQYDNFDQLNSDMFIDFLKLKYKQLISTKKTEPTIKKYESELAVLIDLISSSNINHIFNFVSKLSAFKNRIIETLDLNQQINSFYIDATCYHKTGPEGYVVSTKTCLVKLVNRFKFSKLNFSSEIKRGW